MANAPTVFSSLVGRWTDLIALEARILGQITTGSTTTITNYIESDSFILIRAMLMAKLRAHPALAREISLGLLQIESQKEIIDVEATQISGAALESENDVAARAAADESVVPAMIGEAAPTTQLAPPATAGEISVPQNPPAARPSAISLEQSVTGATRARLER
jgi:hypothetical protein